MAVAATAAATVKEPSRAALCELLAMEERSFNAFASQNKGYSLPVISILIN